MSTTDSLSFLNLIGDVHHVIVYQHLNFASRLSLALTCRTLRKYSPSKDPIFNPWAFAESCARFGYLDLLRYGYDKGAPIDAFVLNDAVRFGNVELALWLYSKVRYSLGKEDTELITHRICRNVSLLGNKVLIDTLRPHGNSLNIVCYLLEGGHSSLALEYLPSVEKDDPFYRYFGSFGLRVSPNAYQSAGIGGDLEGAKKILALVSPGVALHSVEYRALLKGALTSGSLPIIRFFFDNNLPINGEHMVSFGGLAKSAETLRAVFEFMPRQIIENVTLLADSACSHGTLSVLHWLGDFGYSFSRGDIHTLLTASRLCSVSYVDFDFESFGAKAEELIDCAKYLRSLGYSWTAEAIFRSHQWASYSQLKYLIDNSLNPEEYTFSGRLLCIAASLNRMELEMLKFLIEKGGTPSPQDFVFCAHLDNAVELITYLLSLSLPKKIVVEAAKQVLQTYFCDYAQLFTINTFSTFIFRNRGNYSTWTKVIGLFGNVGVRIGANLAEEFRNGNHLPHPTPSPSFLQALANITSDDSFDSDQDC